MKILEIEQASKISTITDRIKRTCADIETMLISASGFVDMTLSGRYIGHRLEPVEKKMLLILALMTKAKEIQLDLKDAYDLGFTLTYEDEFLASKATDILKQLISLFVSDEEDKKTFIRCVDALDE